MTLTPDAKGIEKKAAQVNADMLKDLLRVATENMALNPLRIYHSGDPNHASPLHELVSKLSPRKDDKAADKARG